MKQENEACEILVDLLRHYVKVVSAVETERMLERIYKEFGIRVYLNPPKVDTGIDIDVDSLIEQMSNALKKRC